VVAEPLQKRGWEITVDKNVVDILKDEGVDPTSIDSVVWR
jgi:hypothetical protein